MKPIQLTDEIKASALQMFQEMLNNLNANEDLKINISSDTFLVPTNTVKPVVYITAAAHLKMTMLINASTDELAWHGVVEKHDNDYLIKDILVYPQTVTGTTVDADETAYAQWLMSLDDDTINALKFQGHSHVNMATSPSGRDTSNWNAFLNLLRPGEFYLFCIGNKRGEYYWTIYDTAINVMFENKDITVCVIDDNGNSVKAWVDDSVKTYIKKQVTVVNKPTTVVKNNKSIIDDSTRIVPTSVSTTISQIPSDMLGIVEYDLDIDLYYSDMWFSGFRYSNLYQCYTMDGREFRMHYGKKESKKQTKGGKKHESK